MKSVLHCRGCHCRQACTHDHDYQFWPYSEKLPTATVSPTVDPPRSPLRYSPIVWWTDRWVRGAGGYWWSRWRWNCFPTVRLPLLLITTHVGCNRRLPDGAPNGALLIPADSAFLYTRLPLAAGQLQHGLTLNSYPVDRCQPAADRYRVTDHVATGRDCPGSLNSPHAGRTPTLPGPVLFPTSRTCLPHSHCHKQPDQRDMTILNTAGITTAPSTALPTRARTPDGSGSPPHRCSFPADYEHLATPLIPAVTVTPF